MSLTVKGTSTKLVWVRTVKTSAPWPVAGVRARGRRRDGSGATGAGGRRGAGRGLVRGGVGAGRLGRGAVAGSDGLRWGASLGRGASGIACCCCWSRPGARAAAPDASMNSRQRACQNAVPYQETPPLTYRSCRPDIAASVSLPARCERDSARIARRQLLLRMLDASAVGRCCAGRRLRRECR